MHDVLGDHYTLLDLRADCDASRLLAAFRSIGAPFEVVRLDEPQVRDVFGRSILLLRPDLHVVWSGNATRPDPLELACRSTGHQKRVSQATLSTDEPLNPIRR